MSLNFEGRSKDRLETVEKSVPIGFKTWLHHFARYDFSRHDQYPHFLTRLHIQPLYQFMCLWRALRHVFIEHVEMYCLAHCAAMMMHFLHLLDPPLVCQHKFILISQVQSSQYWLFSRLRDLIHQTTYSVAQTGTRRKQCLLSKGNNSDKQAFTVYWA